MSSISIRGGRIVDPAQNLDREGHLLIRDGRIVSIEREASTAGTVIDARGCIVCPGLIDARVRFGEPGFEEDETIKTGTAAALAGGFTSVGCMPDTDPVIETRAAAEFLVLQGERAGNCRVFPLGAVTKGTAGEELSEIGQLVDGGAVAFTDGKKPVENAEVMRRALQYAGMFGRAILHHAEVPELVTDGVMHDGYHSTVLGLRGMPAAAEEIMVRRDIALAEITGGRVHLMAISTGRSVEEVRQARKRGVKVSADVTPHHLLLTDEEMQRFDSNTKVRPPLRPAEEINALILGLKDGTIEVICSDHQPYAAEKKEVELDLAPFGIVGLETVIPLCVMGLIQPGHLTWSELVSKLTIGPARVLGLDHGTLVPGTEADVTVIDPAVEWVVDSRQFRSKARNTPFDGRKVRGRARMTIVGGEVKWQNE